MPYAGLLSQADIAANAAVDEQIGVEHAVDSGVAVLNPFTGEARQSHI